MFIAEAIDDNGRIIKVGTMDELFLEKLPVGRFVIVKSCDIRVMDDMPFMKLKEPDTKVI